ncbi:flavodoxin family protein [Lacticaseibacillus porcinae]|uniref:flavodoxin family protein n=1 Tax=Lacticaseibacillus porcinae TaxID=1123687 RepID=UPI000F780C6A|nr:NAD(P)H-dependent oxidoreductase [Lacticaseibacillus porcinae]
MHTVALFGGQDPHGLTAQLPQQLLNAIDGTTEFIDLNPLVLHPDRPNQPNVALDALERELAKADVWILVSPTYYGTVAGPLKQALDCLRPRIIRMTSKGDSLPGKYRGKVYLTISSCFASGFDNTFTHQTDACFKMLDKAMSTAGLRKAGELVLPNTWGMTAVPEAKQHAAEKLATTLPRRVRKDDETMKRYGLLFVMVAVMAFATMSLQLLLPLSGFWWNYISFVIIFFCLLAGILHYATFMRHKHR